MRSRYTTLFCSPIALRSLAVQITVGAIAPQPQMMEPAPPGQPAPICRAGTAFPVTAAFAPAGRITTTVSAQNPGTAMPATDQGRMADVPLNGITSNRGEGA